VKKGRGSLDGRREHVRNMITAYELCENLIPRDPASKRPQISSVFELSSITGVRTVPTCRHTTTNQLEASVESGGIHHLDVVQLTCHHVQPLDRPLELE
jgi:hypothetical protein